MKAIIFKRVLLLSFITLISGCLSQVYGVLNPDSLRFEALQKLSSEFVFKSYPIALSKAQEALIIAEKSGTREFLARANNKLGYLYWINGDYYKSISNLDIAFKIFIGLNDIKAAAFSHHTKALNYYYMAMNDSAIHYHQEALALYKSINEEKLAGKVLSHIALSYHKMGKYEQTIEYILKSNRIRDKYSESHFTYNYKNSNPAFRDSPYYQAELVFHKTTLEQAVEADDKLKIADAMHNIGLSYYLLEDFENALKYFNESNEGYTEEGRIAYWNESVRALRELGRYDEALELLEKHRIVVKNRGTRISLSEIYELHGDIYFKIGDYEKAIEYYQLFYNLSYQLNNRLALTSSLRKLAQSYISIGNFTRARKLAKESLALSKTIEAIEEEKTANGILAEIESETGNFKQAYHYQVVHSYLTNQINEGEASINMVKAQAEYDSFKKSEEIDKLRLEGLIQESNVDKMKIIMISTFIFSISVLTLTFVLYHRNRLKAKTNRLLEKKNSKISKQAKLLENQNKEKELLLSETHHRAKNNLQVINSLLSIHAQSLKDENAKMAIAEGQNRVQVMGLLHENLYQRNDFGAIDMQKYLEQLADNLVVSYGFSNNLTLEIKANDIKLNEDTAIFIGLISNELITNSFKYAFKEVNDPTLKINLILLDNGLNLDIADNGCGIEDFDSNISNGLTLVKELVKHLEGKIYFNWVKGTNVSVILKKFKVAA